MSDTGVDTRVFNNLVIYDRDAQAIFDAAITLARARQPDWAPIENNTEVVLLEAMAMEVSELTFAINRLPGAITLVLLQLFELAPDYGAAPDAVARFHFSSVPTAGLVIRPGTRLRWRTGPNERSFTLYLASPLVVAAGQTEGTVAVVGLEPGVELHSAAVGDRLELLDQVLYVDSVALDTIPANGRAPETTLAFITRGVEKLRTLVTTLVLPQHFEASALLNPAVLRVKAIDNYDPATGPSPGSNPGHVTVAVLGLGGANVTTAVKAAIDADMEAKALANLSVHVTDATVTGVYPLFTLQIAPNYNHTLLQRDVEIALADYLNPLTWPWNSTVWENELIALLDRVPGVIRVKENITFLRNLLSANAASVETSVADYTAGANTTLSQQTTWAIDGTHSMRAIATGAGTLRFTLAAGSQVTVAAGDTVTARVDAYLAAAPTRNVRVGLSWWTAGGVQVGTIAWGNLVTEIAGDVVQPFVTAVAPATTARARLEFEVQGIAGAGEATFFDRMGIHVGPGAVWQPGGQPVDPTAGTEPNQPLAGYAPLAKYGGSVITLEELT